MDKLNKGKRCTVFYAVWQMQCCGTPFSVGDKVEWTVLSNNAFNSPVDIGKIDYCYDAHYAKGDKVLAFEGRVEEIKILYHKFIPSKDNKSLIAVSGKVSDINYVNGWEDNIEDMKVVGYVVSLSDCVLNDNI